MWMLKMFGTLNLWVFIFVGIQKCGYSIYVGICENAKSWDIKNMGTQNCGFLKCLVKICVYSKLWAWKIVDTLQLCNF